MNTWTEDVVFVVLVLLCVGILSQVPAAIHLFLLRTDLANNPAQSALEWLYSFMGSSKKGSVCRQVSLHAHTMWIAY